MLKEENKELDEMLETLGYKVVSRVVQKRRTPDNRYYVGPGKLEEIKSALGPLDVERIVVDGVLTPSQHHNIEHELKKDVRDRVWLVLEIFEKNATSHEAKLQVDLARMQYMAPFIREWIHKAREGEHPGFMGGGEYGLDDYYLFIKRKRKTIIEQLKRSEAHGTDEKRSLKERGWLVVGLAGYTNAGKSTLHDAICKSSVEISPLMFTTLQPKSSSVAIWNAKAVIEDTIGFVEGLPNDVIEGFRVTLNRLRNADSVLLVVDAGDSLEGVIRKTKVSWDILRDSGVQSIIPVLNKSDSVEPGRIPVASNAVKGITGSEPVIVSGKDKLNLDAIFADILIRSRGVSSGTISIPQNTAPEVLNSALSNMIIFTITPNDEEIKIEFHCRNELLPKIMYIIKREKGTTPNNVL